MRSPLSLIARLWGPAALAVVLAGTALGQTLAPDDPSPLIVIDGSPDDDAPADGAEIEALPSIILREASAPKDRSTADWLIPLLPVHATPGQPDQTYRLEGQRSETTFRMFLPTGALGGNLTLAYRSSINVLPSGSRVTVLMNGSALGSFSPDSFSSAAPVALPLAGSSARAGENLVTIVAEHRHRIFCGPEANFAVWTDIDLSQSGVVVAAPAVDLGPEGFVAALTAQVAAGNPVEIRSAVAPEPETLRSIASALGRAAGGAALPIRVASAFSVSLGKAQTARVSLLEADSSSVEIRRGGDGALVLVIEHPAGVAPDLAPLDALLALPSPLVAPAGPVGVVPGQATSFAALGIPTVVSSEYYFRHDVTFRLPDDWLVLGSQKARVDLDYGFAAGLPEGGLVLVKANGTTVRMLPIDRDGGVIQPRLPISFGADLLRPGVNSIGFEAIIPGDPPDLPCPSRESDMLTILDSSQVYVPTMPRMQLADMARTLGGMDGSNIVLTEGANIALALPFAAALPKLEATSRAVLRIVDFSELNGVPLGERAGRARAIDAVLQPFVAIPVSTPLDEPVSPGAARSAPTAPARLQALTDAAPEATDAAEPGWIGLIWENLAASVVAAERRLVKRGDGPLQPWLEGRHAQAVLLSLEADRPDRVWLVLGPGVDPAAAATALQAGRSSAEGPRGQVSLLQVDGTWASWVSGDARPMLIEPLRMSNLRAVLGNYFSWLPPVLTLAMFGLAWITALLALFYVVTTRGNRQR